MPAKEDTYRNQKALHIVFAVSSIAMMASIIWMIAKDHFREWKMVQRDFMKYDAAKTQQDAEAAKSLADEAEMKRLDGELDEARQAAAGEVAEASKTIRDVLGKVQKADQALAFQKADRDSIASLYDIEVDKKNETGANRFKLELDGIDARIDELRRESEDRNDQMDAAKKRIEAANETHGVTKKQKEIADKQKERDRVDRKKWSFGAAFRSSPVVDAFAPALKIEQIVLNDFTIHYSFKGVPRFDRCTTCHKGIDSITKQGGPAYDEDSVMELSTSPYRAAFATHSRPELFAGPNSPHSREKFGCTVCHLGQGSATSFVFASHTPNSVEQGKDWKENKEKGLAWHDVHDWPWKMNRARFVESACIKCHTHVVDLDSPKYGNTAAKVLKGYNIVRQYGCFGCHEVNGWKNARMIGPDLRLEPQSEADRGKVDSNIPHGRQRKVGPSLRHIADKVPEDWTHRWISLPQGFRPTTRMPQFYGLTNNSGTVVGSDAADVARSNTEMHAIVHYLYTNSEPAKLADPPEGVAVDPKNADQIKRGHDRFIERGCLACHSHKDVNAADFPQADANFGPDLSNVAAKLKDKDGNANTKWLFNWLKDPTVYHATSFMPNLQLKDDEAADIAAWLLSVEGGWKQDPGRPERDAKVLNDLISLFLNKSMTLKQAEEALSKGVPAERVKDIKGDEKMLVAPITPEKKLAYLGKKTISRMGCFGCHDIPGFETAKPIGTELTSWGLKARMDPDKLDFAHIVEYLETPAFEKDRHNPDFELFADEMKHHRGESFLWQKLRDPRSYDYHKDKAWDDKLRMPRFPFADNPEDVEAVMTFVLGLVGDDSIPQHYRNTPQSGSKFAMIEGQKALTKFNCQGCHMTTMAEFAIDIEKAKPDFSTHATDFPEVVEFQKQHARKSKPSSTVVHVSAMLRDADPPLERPGVLPKTANELYLDVWQPQEIDGQHFFAGDNLDVKFNAVVFDKSQPAEGGQFAQLLVAHLLGKGNKTFQQAWSQVPPPLVREGMKVQPAWLHRFLLNPFEIRPAVVLRMPKFNMSKDEAEHLAAYFAAVDGVPYPYDDIGQRDESYLARKQQQHPKYLADGWALLTAAPDAQAGSTVKLCVNCHNVGNKPAGGEAQDRGPDLWMASERLRPEWLEQWTFSPRRMMPFTGMPPNFTHGKAEYQNIFAGSSSEQVTAVRDALVNYPKILSDLAIKQQVAQPASGGK